MLAFSLAAIFYRQVQNAGVSCTGSRFYVPDVQVPGVKCQLRRFQVSGDRFYILDVRLEVPETRQRGTMS